MRAHGWPIGGVRIEGPPLVSRARNVPHMCGECSHRSGIVATVPHVVFPGDNRGFSMTWRPVQRGPGSLQSAFKTLPCLLNDCGQDTQYGNGGIAGDAVFGDLGGESAAVDTPRVDGSFQQWDLLFGIWQGF